MPPLLQPAVNILLAAPTYGLPPTHPGKRPRVESPSETATEVFLIFENVLVRGTQCSTDAHGWTTILLPSMKTVKIRASSCIGSETDLFRMINQATAQKPSQILKNQPLIQPASPATNTTPHISPPPTNPQLVQQEGDVI